MRRRIERATGRLPSEGEAFEAMLDHAIACWRGEERGVLACDGFRCTAPGCTSYRNLHLHHVRWRSAGRVDEEANLTTLCAWHHLRGVHGGRMRLSGRAPDALRFSLATPLG